MDFTWQDRGGWVEAHVVGLLDNDSAEPLSQALSELIRGGHHRLLLNVSGVTYLSSAGISALLKAHKQLTAIRGFFGVSEPPLQVAEVLRLTRLDQLLVRDIEAAAVRNTHTTTMAVLSDDDITAFDSGGLRGITYRLGPREPLSLRLIGDPSRISHRAFGEGDSHAMSCPEKSFAIGLGALGPSFADCQDRFGEFVAANGAVAHQPTGGRRAADFQMTVGDFVPQVQTLTALQFSGEFSHLIRFRAEGELPRVPTSRLVGQLWRTSEATSLGVVIVAESAGLVGTSLMQSPVRNGSAGEVGSVFQHPNIRGWLSYAPEHVHDRALVVVVGVIARGSSIQKLSNWLRPLDAERLSHGHLHAAVFGYRPMKKGFLELAPTVSSSFESESLQAVLHLLADHRPINGAGESEFVGGACWFGELAMKP